MIYINRDRYSGKGRPRFDDYEYYPTDTMWVNTQELLRNYASDVYRECSKIPSRLRRIIT